MITVVAIHHLGHLLVHLLLYLFRIATLHIALQLWQDDLPLGLRLASFGENFCFDILLQLGFEVMVVLHLKTKIVAVVMLDGLGGTLSASLVFDRLDRFAIRRLLCQSRLDRISLLLCFCLRKFFGDGSLSDGLVIIEGLLMGKRFELLLVMHNPIF